MKSKQTQIKSDRRVGEICAKCKEEIILVPRTVPLRELVIRENWPEDRIGDIPMMIDYWVCNCGKDFDPDLVKEQAEMLGREHEAEHMGPARIRQLRKMFGMLQADSKKELTQQGFADLVGAGVASIVRWETGERLPSGAHEKLLRFLEKDERRQKEYWYENTDKIEHEEKGQIARLASQLIVKLADQRLREQRSVPKEFWAKIGLDIADLEEGVPYLEAYREEHGHARIPNGYMTKDNYPLGSWVQRIRTSYSMGRWSPSLSDKLKSSGFDLNFADSDSPMADEIFRSEGMVSPDFWSSPTGTTPIKRKVRSK